MEKVKEVVSKNGLYIKLGALVVAFIGLFLDFLKISSKGSKYSFSESYMNYKDLYEGSTIDYNGLAVLVLILIIVSIVWVLAEKYAKDLYEKVPKKVAPYVLLATSGVAFIVTLYDALSYKSRIIKESKKALKALGDSDYVKQSIKPVPT